MSARIFTWLPLPHLPQVPKHFVDRILELAVPTTDPEGCLLQKRGTITAEFKHRPIDQWILFNGHVLHGVENIKNHRVNINITVRPEHFSFDIANPL